ncbi:fimbrial protein [Erwinia sp. 198]|uniref:fimbrial protein n=1 Tax=Erwinia sp. 198 TaxID=2022746 RepID=UPI000F67B667|nr:fimbrial protein [Erwinia sp. 198]RRZ92975.1 hypothetical protein EGK14_09655 [Erwinia sp. 198]
MKKYWITLLLALLTVSTGVRAGCSLKSGSTVKANDSLNLSALLTMQDSHSETRTATWSVPVGCFAVTNSNAVHYVSPVQNGFWVKFVNAAGAARWIKIQASGFTDLINYENGDRTLEGSAFSYQLTATLLDSDPGVTDSKYYKVVENGSVDIVTMVMHNANIFGSTPTVDQAAEVAASGNWNNDYLGYQSLTVTFSPAETTCEMPDQQVVLPRVSLNLLRSGIATDRTSFTLPVNCSATLAGGATRSVNAWLYSADLLENSQRIMRNGSSSSQGVGIVLSDSAGKAVSLSGGTAAGEATSLLSIAKGADIHASAINLNAAYKVFDPANLSPGSVVATATIYFDYD